MEKEKKVIRGFKGFNKDLMCMGFQYEVGKEYECEKAVVCEEGFHFCENPIAVLGYYRPSDSKGISRYCEVEGSGEFDRNYTGDKICCTKIKIVRELTIQELIEECLKYCEENVDREQAVVSDENESTANNKYNNSTTVNNGHCSVANNTGNYAVAKNTGMASIASALGAFSLANSIGKFSIAVASSFGSVANSSGVSSMAVSFSDCSVTATSSENSVSINIGDGSCAYNNGNGSLAVSTGYNSIAIADGKDSIALTTGVRGKAKGSLGNWIILIERYDWCEGTRMINDIKAFLVDGVNIKADTYYQLINGEPVEVE